MGRKISEIRHGAGSLESGGYMRVNKSEIVDHFLICPYCMSQVDSEMLSHCGESSAHFETVYRLTDNNLYVESDLTIEDSKNETN